MANVTASKTATEPPQTESTVDFPVTDSLRKESAQSSVPWSVRVAAALSWRLLIIAAAAVGAVWLLIKIQVIILPIAIALLLAVLITPFVTWMHRRLRLPRALAAAFGLLIPLALVIGALSGASTQIISDVPRLVQQATKGLDAASAWVKTLPLNIDTTILDHLQENIQSQVTTWVTQNSSLLASGAVNVTSSVVSVLSGLLIVLFVLFFFLKDGRQIWLWVVRLLPEPARIPVHESAIRGWVTLSGYVRSQIQVAAIDALGIGLGAYFLGLPMVVPIMVVVFFGSFIPILGALLSGSIAVLLALVDQGPMAGLIMLGIILLVQQIEGNLLQPLIMSNAVSLHPMAVLLVVAACGTVAGIPGAIFGVPVAAFLNATLLYLHGYDPIPALATNPDRPGGPPGTLHQMIVDSYRKEGAAPVMPIDEAASSSGADGDPKVEVTASVSQGSGEEVTERQADVETTKPHKDGSDPA
ncbi:AI-2E family transporter [Schaalia suimastitidis]|uniref:AI-2E family transporter n=1 Tax=Schaalia suimastitidis TaxID=121163 RepID=UPI00103E2619